MEKQGPFKCVKCKVCFQYFSPSRYQRGSGSERFKKVDLDTVSKKAWKGNTFKTFHLNKMFFKKLYLIRSTE